MATNPYFSNFTHTPAQNLLRDLIIDAIQIYGQDMFYLPRNLNNYDQILGADDQSSYTLALPLETYILSYDGFQGDGNFMSKFGLEIRDQITFTVAKFRFDKVIGQPYNMSRPKEGDIIYFPLNQKCFQIKFVNNKDFFYQLGSLPTYELTCELFEYSNELFNTGIPAIDSLQKTFTIDSFDWGFTNETGSFFFVLEDGVTVIEQEQFIIDHVDYQADNQAIQTQSNTFVNWNPSNPFGQT